MTDNVEPLFGYVAVPGAVVRRVVDALESLRQRAERGEIVSVIVASLRPNKGVLTSWFGTATALEQMGMVAALQAEAADDWQKRMEQIQPGDDIA